MRTVRSSSRLPLRSLAGRVSARWGVGPGGVCRGGGCLPRGVVFPSMHWGRHPLWTEWLTDRCKNITLPQFINDTKWGSILYLNRNDRSILDLWLILSNLHSIFGKGLTNLSYSKPEANETNQLWFIEQKITKTFWFDVLLSHFSCFGPTSFVNQKFVIFEDISVRQLSY